MRRREGRVNRALVRYKIGQELRQLRHAKGLTLAQVGALAGVSHAHLSQLERGISDPSSEVLATLFDALDVVPVIILHQRRREGYVGGSGANIGSVRPPISREKCS